MIALIASVLLGLYVFFPDFLFKKFLSQYVELKKNQRTRFEDVVAGLAVVVVPLVAAFIVTHVFSFCGHWPFPVEEPITEKWADYKVVFSAAYSDSYFNGHQQEFWNAAKHTWSHQLRFLVWNYLFLALEITVVGLATKNFGSWRNNRFYAFIFGDTVLRRCSQWYVLFQAFMFPRQAKPRVMLDILTTDKHLYDGELADYFVDQSGNLSELLLKGFRRFRFKAFEDARLAAQGEGKKVRSADYWTNIPGANLLIPYNKIANINIRYVFTSESLTESAQSTLRELRLPAGVSVTVTEAGGDPVDGLGD